ncbi:DUF397 domain-containing protein [Streptomyces iconiensis]|uniref:DUF397 domain-containing protein n=1 Tax=Streptomyces iconiensis TaxID=1384038 RepID=A0ABT6ZQV5_9ACTN|nr:DUF397 domain-containing protein [Streptomyces iconiensis]MDJ1131437.1 DUF397 domain-containing protein [Streptomyces iconiensis]
MERFANGVRGDSIPDVEWMKSSLSSPTGNCVELARLPEEGLVAMRNSRHPDGPALVYTREEMVAFVGAAKRGEFDCVID